MALFCWLMTIWERASVMLSSLRLRSALETWSVVFLFCSCCCCLSCSKSVLDWSMDAGVVAIGGACPIGNW